MEINYFNIQLTLALGPVSRKVNIISSGSRLGIMGPSGCGKSSLARAMAGINPLVKGEIYFKNRSYSNVPAWNRNFAYLPQDIQLFPHLTVAENILFPKNSRLLDEVIEGFQISHLMSRMPRNLSGGEKQRVGLARALSASSDLLILDEPFSSLDFSVKNKSIAFLDQITQSLKLPMILVSHNEAELNLLNCAIFSFDHEEIHF